MSRLLQSPVRRLVAVFLVVFLAVLIFRFPLSAALGLAGAGAQGLSYTRAEGTVWNGTLHDAAFGPYPLGRVQVSLKALPLFWGTAALEWDVSRPGLNGTGTLARTLGGTLRIGDAKLSLDLSTAPTLVPMRGSLWAEVDKLAIGTDGCREAAGYLSTDGTIEGLDRAQWDMPRLEGPVSCADSALRLPLAGQGPENAVAAEVRVGPDLRYVVNVRIETVDPDVQNALLMLGFSGDAPVYELTQQGVWRAPRSGADPG